MKFKTAEEWVQEYMESEEFKLEVTQMDKELKDYILYGEPTTDEFLEELVTEFLPMEVIIERYSLTDKQIENLNKLRGNYGK